MPENLTIWEWLFESPDFSPLYERTVDVSKQHTSFLYNVIHQAYLAISLLAGYVAWTRQGIETSKPFGAFIDAETKERLDYAEVKAKSSALSTCWINQYGLEPGHTVSVYSGNTIWYPVCMFAVVRAGKSFWNVSNLLDSQ